MITLTDSEINEITKLIFDKHQLDFRNYAKSSLSRRLTRIMTVNVLNTKEELIKYIEHITNIDKFIEEVTVNTTEMFRDPSFWYLLKHKILPELSTHQNIKIWHAGCSSGEEVVSLQILLHEMGLRDKVTAYASDIDKSILEKAQKSEYALKNLALNEDNYKKAGGEFELKKYFKETSAFTYRFDEKLLENVTFKKFDLVKDVNYSKFDLILCRNVLIYFDFDLQEQVILKFITNLFSQGFIAIGQKETILSTKIMSEMFLFDGAEKIYRYNK